MDNIKTFHLQSKLGVTDGSIVSIINPYIDGAFPYWISNGTGARLIKIKAMAGEVVAGMGGGTVVTKIYRTDAHAISDNPDISTHGLSASKIADTWEYLTEIDYSASNTEMQYGVDFRMVNINIDKPSFIIGVVELVGDIKIENLFMWIEYIDNPLD